MIVILVLLYLIIGFLLGITVAVVIGKRPLKYGMKEATYYKVRPKIYLLMTLIWPIMLVVGFFVFFVKAFLNIAECLSDLFLDKIS